MTTHKRTSHNYTIQTGDTVNYPNGSPFNNTTGSANLELYSKNVNVYGNTTVRGAIQANLFVGSFSGNVTGNFVVPGSNTQILYNNNGNAGAASAFTYDSATNLLTVSSGDISAKNISLTGNISATGSATVTGNITASGNVSANYYVGNGALLTGLGATYSNANVATYLGANTNAAILTTNTITTSASITSSGANVNSQGLTVAGNATVGNLTAATITLNSSAVALGSSAGQTSQGSRAVAIGSSAGQTSQGMLAIAVGENAGLTTQGQWAIAAGTRAGETNQGAAAISVGFWAGLTTQGPLSVAVGPYAGQTTQGQYSVAVGSYAGETSQGDYSVAIGNGAGLTSQSTQAVAIGFKAGSQTQGANSIAIGTQAGGNSNQGINSVAIGAGAGLGGTLTGSASNSIILNATGTNLPADTSGFFVKPLNSNASTFSLFYNTANGEITYAPSAASYGNSNVANYLPTYTGNLANLTGNVITTANVSGTYFFGNITQANGYIAYANSNVANYLGSNSNVNISIGIANITTQGNITGANIVVNSNLVINTSAQLSAAGGNLTVKQSNLLPSVNNLQNIGNSTSRWANIYVSNASVSNNIFATGNITASGNVNANNINFTGAINLDLPATTNTVVSFGTFAGDVPGSLGFFLQNNNSSNIATTDIAVNNDLGTGNTYYVDLGMASSTYNDPTTPYIKPNDSYLFSYGGVGVGARPSDLVLGTATASSIVKIGSYNTAAANLTYKLLIGDTDIAAIGNIAVTGNVNPSANLQFNLGNVTNRWSNVYSNVGSFLSMNVGNISPNLTQNLGQIIATGNIIAFFSDDRLKTRLGNIENALDKIDAISTFYFEPNDVAVNTYGYQRRRDIGVSAQDTQRQLPEIVADAPIGDGYLTVKYERFAPLIMAGIKELRAEINEIKRRLDDK